MALSWPRLEYFRCALETFMTSDFWNESEQTHLGEEDQRHLVIHIDFEVYTVTIHQTSAVCKDINNSEVWTSESGRQELEWVRV